MLLLDTLATVEVDSRSAPRRTGNIDLSSKREDVRSTTSVGMVMIMVYMAIVRKFVNQDLTRIFGNIFSQIESLTGGTVWTRTLLMHPA